MFQHELKNDIGEPKSGVRVETATIQTSQQFCCFHKQGDYIIFAQTLAASILALGLLAPVAFAEGRGTSTDLNGCPDFAIAGGDYIECQANTSNRSNGSYGLTAPNRRVRGPVGDFVGETAQQKNQRSNDTGDFDGSNNAN